MASITCGSVLVLVSLIAMTNAYYSMHQNQQMSCYRPQYNIPSCRESIEDLKALIDLSDSLKEKNTCETCSRPFSEAVIIKLIDALVTTATRNCYKQDDEKKNGTCGHEKNGNCGNTHTDDGKTGITVGSKDQHDLHKNYEDVLTMETLEAALIKLGVLEVNGDKKYDKSVDVDIRNTDVTGVNVGTTTVTN